jgi:hypothetical protein
MSAVVGDPIMSTIRGAQEALDVICAAPGALDEAPLAAGGKRFATARARSALRGIALHALEDDRGGPLYVASIHALTRQFVDLAEVESWLKRVGET